MRQSPEHNLRLPQGSTLQSLNDPSCAETVSRWLQASPDHTLYHLAPYLQFLRRQNATAELLLVSREGNPQFALPIHSQGALGIDGGYSGLVFPPTHHEATLRRSVAALAALIAANRAIPFHFCQSAQASAYDEPARVALLQQLLESEGFALDPLYARLCDLDRLPSPDLIPVAPGRHPATLAIDADWLAGEPLDAYERSTRNKIRRALRDGLTVEYLSSEDARARIDAYARFQPVHHESWTRTGLLPKTPDHWPALSESVHASGAQDLIVLVLDRAGQPLAGVVCHAYRSRAIYWSGCSTALGLRHGANPLCLHAAIAACRRHGVRTFELGRFRADERSPKERAVNDYKAQFGGCLVRLTSFSSTPTLRARARARRAAAVSEAKRRFSVELGRARARARRRAGARA